MFLDRSLRHRSFDRTPALPLWLLGFVFVAGLAIGTLIPARGHVSGTQTTISTMPPPPAPPQTWSREGNTTVRHSVEVVRVIDGDTFEARVHLWPGLDMTTRVRLRGIDAPETNAACADEARMASAATDALRTQLADGDVTIFNIGPDKYNGRVVADAATRRTLSISQALLAAGHARPYQGGRRGGWCGAYKAG